jgi:hypothetical protein
MNLSRWGAYPVEKRNDLMKEICKEVSDGEMPGSAYSLVTALRATPAPGRPTGKSDG